MDIFSCFKCGNCCQTQKLPLYEWELLRISEKIPKLLMDSIQIRREIYLYKGFGLIAETLIENSFGNCPFLVGNLCSIYPYRPITCQAFPLQKNPLHDPRLLHGEKYRFPKSDCQAKIFRDWDTPYLEFENLSQKSTKEKIQEYLSKYPIEIQNAAAVKSVLDFLKETAKKVIVNDGGKLITELSPSLKLISIFNYIQDKGFLPPDFFSNTRSGKLTIEYLKPFLPQNKIE
jgi:Fe-S-cluster containining protein